MEGRGWGEVCVVVRWKERGLGGGEVEGERGLCGGFLRGGVVS